MCSVDGCDTAAEAQIQLQMGRRIELDFASLCLNTGRASGKDGQYLHPPMCSRPKSYQMCKTSESSKGEIKSQSPGDAEQSTKVLMVRVKGRDSFVPRHSGDVTVGRRGGNSIIYPHCLSNHS